MSSGLLLFGGAEVGQTRLKDASLVVLPVPLEQTVSYGGGTAQAPQAILRASEQLEFLDEETGRPYWPAGSVHTLPAMTFPAMTLPALTLPSDGATAVDRIDEAARSALDGGRFLLTLGGEHTVTAGCVRAASSRYPDLGVLFLDAHLDLRNEYGGTPWSHACVARRVTEMGLAVAWCGTRALAQEEAEFLKSSGLKPFFAHDIAQPPVDGWIDALVDSLPDQVYLSIDVDGLDPSCMPGTGTPEPGGLSYRQLVALIRRLCERRQVVAADIVEVAPIAGQQVSEFTAARIAAKLLGAVTRSRG